MGCLQKRDEIVNEYELHYNIYAAEELTELNERTNEKNYFKWNKEERSV